MQHIAYFLTSSGKILREPLNFAGCESLANSRSYQKHGAEILRAECYHADFLPRMDISHPVLSNASPYRIGNVYTWVPRRGGVAEAYAAAGAETDTPLAVIYGDLEFDHIAAPELTEAMDSLRHLTCGAYKAQCEAYDLAKRPYLIKAQEQANETGKHVIVWGSRFDILTAPAA